jgi:Leucine-rich repeat (LRR) protein
VDSTHLQKLVYVTHLNLNRNCIADGRFLSNAGIFPFLKVLNLSNNKLKSLPSLSLLRINHLNLSNNVIQSVEDFDGHATLVTLELRGNKISSLKGLGKATALKNLYLADNSISSLSGIANLPSL